MASKLDDKQLEADEFKAPIDKPRNHPDVQIPVYSNVELLSEADLSFGAILRGSAANPLTTFEKKAALINAELDKFGLGRYQICIWFLCGFGYFLDLAWSQGVGLIASAIYQEMDVAPADDGIIYSCANAGLAIGALGFGLAVDIIGRKWAFNLTCLITSVFGLLLVCIIQHELPFLTSLGRTKIQLWCDLRHLLPCINWTGR
jgi:hypothetical protein